MLINNIKEAAKLKGLENAEQLRRHVFEYTDCGAWISWGKQTITIGSIVEGSDAEFSKTFTFPVETDVLDEWVNDLEELCDEAWHEANDDFEQSEKVTA